MAARRGIGEARAFGKFTELVGRIHSRKKPTNECAQWQLSAAVTVDIAAFDTPGHGNTALMMGGTDTVLLADKDNPWIMSLYAQFRSEPSSVGPRIRKQVVYAVQYLQRILTLAAFLEISARWNLAR